MAESNNLYWEAIVAFTLVFSLCHVLAALPGPGGQKREAVRWLSITLRDKEIRLMKV